MERMLKASNELSGNSRLFKTYVRTEKRPDGAVYTIVDYFRYNEQTKRYEVIKPDMSDR
jgi:hypothetical protein